MNIEIDIHTLAIVLSLTNLLQVIALFAQYRLDKTHSGPGWWTLGSAAVAMGFAFNYLRDYPGIGAIAIISNNVLFVSGLLLIYAGVLRFLDQLERRGRIIGFCVVYTLVIIYFTYSNDDQAARRVLISIAVAAISFLIARALFVHKTRLVTASADFLTVVFLANSAFFAIRALTPFLGGSVGGAFAPTLTQVATYLVILITSTMWTFGFILLVNQRLNVENRDAKENADLIFNTSPDAVLITRLTDGHFVDMNDGFTVMTGFTRSEVLGKSILEFNIWKDPAERQKLVTLLNEKGSCENLQADLQRKDGSQLTGLVSAKLIILQSVPHIISVTHDITLRQRAEDALRMSEMKYRLLTEFTADVVWILNLTTSKFTYISPSVFQLRGVTAEEAMLETLEDSLTPESIVIVKDAVAKNIKDFIEHPEIPNYYINEVRQFCKNGQIIWIEVSTQYRYSPAGDIEIVGVSRNVEERKKSENALRASEEKFKTMIDTSPDGIAITTLDGIIQFVTAKVVSLWGYDSADELIGRNTMEFVHPSYHEKAIFLITEIINGNLTGAAEYLMVRKDGSLFYAETNANILRDAQNNPFGVLHIERDITERKQAEVALKENAAELESINRQLEVSIGNANEMAAHAVQAEEMMRESEERFRAVFDTANDAIVSTDSTGNIMDWNPGAERIFGYSKIEAHGQPITLILPARHHQGHKSGMERVKTGGEKHVIGKTVEVEGLRKDGSEFPVELSLSEWQVADQRFFAAVIRDITERKRLKEELQQQATMDALTGIFNRRQFQHLVLGELKRANRLKRSLAVVLIDIDHFKHVNDTLGHAAGDLTLLAFTKICQKNIREIDIFARFGGDEFALLLPEASFEQAYVVVDRIRKAVTSQPIDLNGKLVSITISSGIANLSDDEETFDKLLSQADQALYRAKEAGRNKVVGYDEA
jgi:diguanylate cyclase (GGDEF)-like protein/PAS domain S-box-containing protein